MATVPVVRAAGAFRQSKGAFITQNLDSLLRGKDPLLRTESFLNRQDFSRVKDFPLPHPTVIRFQDSQQVLVCVHQLIHPYLRDYSSIALPRRRRCLRNVYAGSLLLVFRYSSNRSCTRSVFPSRMASACSRSICQIDLAVATIFSILFSGTKSTPSRSPKATSCDPTKNSPHRAEPRASV